MAVLHLKKQTVFIFVICLTLIIGTRYYLYQKNLNHLNVQGQELSAVNNTSNAVLGDIPTYGNSDWKKQFVSTSTKTSSQTVTTETDKLTATDYLGRNLFADYIEMRQSNLTKNTDAVNKVTQNLIDESFASINPKIYGLSDLKIISSSNKDSLTTFSSEITDVLTSYKNIDNEAKIMETYFANNDSRELDRISPLLISYQKILDRLLSIPTPITVGEEMLGIVNSMSTIKFSGENIMMTHSDPMKGLIGINAYAGGVRNMVDMMANLKSNLAQDGVSFESNQPILSLLLGIEYRP